MDKNIKNVMNNSQIFEMLTKFQFQTLIKKCYDYLCIFDIFLLV